MNEGDRILMVRHEYMFNQLLYVQRFRFLLFLFTALTALHYVLHLCMFVCLLACLHAHSRLLLVCLTWAFLPRCTLPGERF